MVNFDDYAVENKTEHNLKWGQQGVQDLGKTDALLNLINNHPDIDKIYLYAKDPYEAEYQFLINKRGSSGLKIFNDPKAFIEYSNDMKHVYKNIEEYNTDKGSKILIAFDDIIADMIKLITKT